MRKSVIKNFVSHFINGKTFIGYAGEIDRFGSTFGIEELTNNTIENIDNYDYKKNDTFDSIILDLPYGRFNRELNDKKIKYISYFIDHLNDNGLLVVGLEPTTIISIQREGYNVVGVIEGRRGDLPNSSVIPLIAIFSKKKISDKLFIASFENTDDGATIYNNLKKNISGNDLSEGIFINTDFTLGCFNAYKAFKQIESLQTAYKEFDSYELNSLCDIKLVHDEISKNDENCLYLSAFGKKVVLSFDDIEGNITNRFQIKVIKNDIISCEYLYNYLKTDIAKLSLEGCMQGNIIQKINKGSLGGLKIPVLQIDLQEDLNKAYRKLQDMKKKIEDIENRLSTNPKSVNDVLSDLDENKIESISKEVSEGDELIELISHGESLTLEFKQSFFIDVKTKKEEKYIRQESLKNIAGFMNKEGGTLLVGVCDNGEIYGIENDNYKSDDDYLKRFKDIIKTKFEPSILNEVRYNIIKIGGKKVLRVECPASKDLIYLKDEPDRAYVRTNPAVEKISGAQLIKYAREREEAFNTNKY